MNARINTTINAATFGLNAKFDGIVGQFLAMTMSDTGWNWRDAIEASLERGGTADFSETPLGRFFATKVSKGWSWANSFTHSQSTHSSRPHSPSYRTIIIWAWLKIHPSSLIFIATRCSPCH